MDSVIRKFPIGIQNFESLINDGYVYVDKTDRKSTRLNSSH